jgi:hypothetical protein
MVVHLMENNNMIRCFNLSGADVSSIYLGTYHQLIVVTCCPQSKVSSEIKMGSLGGDYSNDHHNHNSNGHSNGDDGHGYPRAPLKQSGLLNEKFASDDLTPVIGREFLKVNIVDDLLNAPDANALLRDLAITSK